MSSSSLSSRFSVRLKGAGIAVLAWVALSGCYTRQIEGIQKDVDKLDRQMHSLSLKNKEAASTKSGSTPAVLQLEDRLNAVTLQQSDIAEEVTTLRQNYADLKTGSGGDGAPLDKKKTASLERQVAENSRKTEAMEKEMAEIRSTFNNTRTELKNVIQLLKEEFGAEEGAVENGAAPSAPTHTSKASSTVEGPPDPMMPAKSEPGLAASSGHASAAKAANSQVAKAGGQTYQVRPRDTLSTIAKKYGVTTEALEAANGIDDPRNIKMGQTLRIP
jgi:hypothetical protein